MNKKKFRKKFTVQKTNVTKHLFALAYYSSITTWVARYSST